MPDHIHLLVATGGETLGRCVQLFKGRCTRWVRLKGLDGAVWQKGYHDRAIRRSVGILRALEYMVMNPVRAGLVKDWQDYPWIGSPLFGPLDQELLRDSCIEHSLWKDVAQGSGAGR